MQSLQEHQRIANVVQPGRNTIYLQTIEKPFPEAEALNAVKEYLTAFFRLPVKMSHVPWEDMNLRSRPGRSGFGVMQLSMDDLLSWLKVHVSRVAHLKLRPAAEGRNTRNIILRQGSALVGILLNLVD